jgi:hypothetical protein
MISEIVNAIFVTYLASEYFVGPNTHRRSQQPAWLPLWILSLMVMILLNVLDRVSGATLWFQHFFQGLFHLPRILFAAVAYILFLYYDCRASIQSSMTGTANTKKKPMGAESSTSTSTTTSSLSFTWQYFLRHVGMAFCHILPLYPFLAVVISFGFLLVISVVRQNL